MKTLGIVGFGQFGQLVAKHIAGRVEVSAWDLQDLSAEADKLNVKFGSLEEAAGSELVMISVPVQAMQNTFRTIAPFLKPGAVVMDVASVKVLPVQWMVEELPDHVEIIGSHPLFGPQSARNGLKGLPLVICPVRGDKHHAICKYADSLGLKVNVTTPQEHDEEMAYVQALTHLIGRSLLNMKVPDEQLKTRSYQHLLELCSLIENDTFELFSAIQNLNPYARDIANQFVAEAAQLLEMTKPKPA
jgi:prephenate dehydrogenase